MGTDICLPVARYSHAIGLRPDNSVPWTHLQSSNLFIIVKGTDKGVEDEKLMLRIVQANGVLESLDVSDCVDRAVRTCRSAQNKGEALRPEQLPIFGMTKDAAVALRYTLRDGQARRVQMRMHTPAECRQIVNALQSRGMQFTEQRQGTARPGTGRPLTMTSQVVTPQPSSPYLEAPQHQARHPSASQVIEAGSLSHPRPASPEHDISRFDNMQRQERAYPQDMPPPKLFTRDETFAPREVAPTRPSTAQVYRSYSIQPQPARFDAHDIVHQAHKSGLARPSSTSNTTAAEALNEAVEQYQSPPHSAVNEHVSYPAFDANHAGGSQFPDSSATMGPPSNDRPGTARPTTSSSFVFPETLEHEIPPRRELPFQRPDSRRSGSDAGGARPRSALTLPPLPKPRLSPQNSTYEARQKPASPRPQTSSPLKRSFADMSNSADGIERPNTASPSKKLASARVPSPQAPAKKPSRMEELLQSRKLSLEKSSTSKTKRTDSLADAPGEEDDSFLSKDLSPSKAPAPRDSMSPVRRTNEAQDATANAYAAISSAVQRSDSLARYAGQSLEDRQAALDEFMVQNLENPDFTKLCRDVENCWRRIALGL